MTANKKRGLGRGLDALFKDEESNYFLDENIKRSDSSTKTANTLSISKLQPGKYQPRQHFNKENLTQLADSIKTHGILQPILVRPIGDDKFEIIAGERRWRASQLAKLHDIPVVIREMNDEDALEIALIENLHRSDLTALEEADGYIRLINEFSYSQENLAKKLGKSRSHIANTMRLTKLPNPIKTMLNEDKISVGHARALLSIPEDKSINLAKDIVKKSLSVRDVEKIINNKPPKANISKPVQRTSKDADVLALEKDLSNMLGMKTELETNGKKGKLIINYSDLDQLDDVLAKLSLRK